MIEDVVEGGKGSLVGILCAYVVRTGNIRAAVACGVVLVVCTCHSRLGIFKINGHSL